MRNRRRLHARIRLVGVLVMTVHEVPDRTADERENPGGRCRLPIPIVVLTDSAVSCAPKSACLAATGVGALASIPARMAHAMIFLVPMTFAPPTLPRSNRRARCG